MLRPAIIPLDSFGKEQDVSSPTVPVAIFDDVCNKTRDVLSSEEDWEQSPALERARIAKSWDDLEEAQRGYFKRNG